MLDQLKEMMGSPRMRDMVFGMIAQEVAKGPPEKRESLSRVTVTLERLDRGIRLEVVRSDDPEIEKVIRNAIEGWAEMVARGFQSMGFRVEIVD